MQRLMSALDRTIEIAVVVIFAAMIAVGTAQVFNRYFLNVSLSWSEEFQRYGQIWLIFLAVPIAYRRGMHMGIEGLRGHLGETGLRWFERFVDLLWMVLGVAICIGTLRLMTVLKTQSSAGLNLPMHWVYGGLLIGSLYLCLISGRRLAGSLDIGAGR